MLGPDSLLQVAEIVSLQACFQTVECSETRQYEPRTSFMPTSSPVWTCAPAQGPKACLSPAAGQEDKASQELQSPSSRLHRILPAYPGRCLQRNRYQSFCPAGSGRLCGCQGPYYVRGALLLNGARLPGKGGRTDNPWPSAASKKPPGGFKPAICLREGFTSAVAYSCCPSCAK